MDLLRLLEDALDPEVLWPVDCVRTGRLSLPTGPRRSTILNGPLDLADAFDRYAIARLQGIGLLKPRSLASQLAVLRMHRRHAEALAQIIEASVDQAAGARWMLSVYDATWPLWALVRCGEAPWIANTIQDQRLIGPEFTCGLGESTATTGSSGG